MPESSSFARVVLTTAADADEAKRLARVLVEERLVACATLIPSVRSIYRWQGEVEESTEILLLLKPASISSRRCRPACMSCTATTHRSSSCCRCKAVARATWIGCSQACVRHDDRPARSYRTGTRLSVMLSFCNHAVVNDCPSGVFVCFAAGGRRNDAAHQAPSTDRQARFCRGNRPELEA